jgi:hypothetical protein
MECSLLDVFGYVLLDVYGYVSTLRRVWRYSADNKSQKSSEVIDREYGPSQTRLSHEAKSGENAKH